MDHRNRARGTAGVPEAISVSEPSEQLEGQTDWFTILSQAKVRASGS